MSVDPISIPLTKATDAPTRRVWAGWLLIVASLLYLTGEAVAAFAWSDPTYSYATNFISDLGYRGPPAVFMGRSIYSPWQWSMNAAFAQFGALSLLAASLLASLVSSTLRRVSMLVLYGGQLAGLVLLTIFPESPGGLDDGSMVVHGIGALLAILGGNIGAAASGAWSDAAALPVGTRRIGVALGVVGLAALVALVVVPSAGMGSVERVAVYTVTAWNIVWGVSLLRFREND